MTSRSAAPAERSTAALVALCMLLVCTRAQAQSSEPVELTWNAPPGCSSDADVQARLRKLLAAPAGPTKPTLAALRAEATITRSADGRLQLKLVIRAGDLIGERIIAGRSCEDLAGAAAVNLALLLDSREPLKAEDVGTLPATEPDRPSPPDATTPVTPRPDLKPEAGSALPTESDPPAPAGAQPDRVTEADAPSTRNWRALLAAPVAALELGPLSKPSFGGAVAAGLLVDRWRIFAEGSLWLRQKLSITTPLPAGANVDRFAATLRMCRGYPFGRFELAPCAQLSLQHISARGTGAHIAARTRVSTWVAPGVGAQARFQLTSWLGLLGGIDAAIEGARPRIEVDGVGRVGQLGPAALKIATGLEWIL